MKKRLKKKKAYKDYIQNIFKGYETMLADPTLDELSFTYLKEETVLKRDEQRMIRFTTYDKNMK